jgi:hypothetical protein
MKKLILVSKKNWDAILILGIPVITFVSVCIYNSITIGCNPIGV